MDISSTYVDHRSTCNTGYITRTFTASTVSNGNASCTQTIHFFNPHPFDIDDITWPKDYTVNGCYDSADYGPDLTGWPVMKEDACDLVAASYKDQVFHFNDDDLDAEGSML